METLPESMLDVELERRVLAAVLRGELAGSDVRPDLFFSVPRCIVDGTLAVAADGQANGRGLEFLAGRLTSDDLLQIGGLSGLTGFVLDTLPLPSDEQQSRALARLNELAARRAIFAGVQDLARAAADAEVPVDRLQAMALRISVTAPAAPGRGPQLRWMADVEPETVSWLWHPYIPIGKLTLLEGDPGVGKSWVSLALATAVSLGHGLPGMAPIAPSPAVLLTGEDGLGDTIRPRLDAMGANVGLVFALEGPFTFGADGLAVLQDVLVRTNPAVVIIDPLVAYLGGAVDIHRANEVRALLAPLAALAEEHRCAIVAVRHLTKGGRDHAIYRGIGSIDFTAAARSVLLAGCDPADVQRRAVVHVKSNLAPFGRALGYALRDGSFLWTGESDLTAGRILAGADEGGSSDLAEAESFLRDLLAAGSRPVDEVQREAKEAGIAERTLDRAKAHMGIRARRQNAVGGTRGQGCWTWSIPDDQALQECHGSS